MIKPVTHKLQFHATGLNMRSPLFSWLFRFENTPVNAQNYRFCGIKNTHPWIAIFAKCQAMFSFFLTLFTNLCYLRTIFSTFPFFTFFDDFILVASNMVLKISRCTLSIVILCIFPCFVGLLIWSTSCVCFFSFSIYGACLKFALNSNFNKKKCMEKWTCCILVAWKTSKYEKWSASNRL